MKWEPKRAIKYKLESPTGELFEGKTDNSGMIQHKALAGSKITLVDLPPSNWKNTDELVTNDNQKLFDPLYLQNRDEGGSGPLIKSDTRRSSSEQQDLVTQLQYMFKALEYPLGSAGPEKDGVDGVWGDLTGEVVKEFQGKYRDWNKNTLLEDNMVGPRTSDALNRIIVGIWFDRYDTPKELTEHNRIVTITDEHIQDAGVEFDASYLKKNVIVQVNCGTPPIQIKSVRFVYDMEWSPINKVEYTLVAPDGGSIEGSTDGDGYVTDTVWSGGQSKILLTGLNDTDWGAIRGGKGDPLLAVYLRNKADGGLGPLVKGDPRDGWVMDLQSMLETLCDPKVIGQKIDNKGEFGNWTYAAVQFFQQDVNDWEGKELREDKMVGPRTSDALNRYIVGRFFPSYTTPEKLTGKKLKLITVKDEEVKNNGVELKGIKSSNTDVLVQVNRGVWSEKLYKYATFHEMYKEYYETNTCENDLANFEDAFKTVIKYFKDKIDTPYGDDKVFVGFDIVLFSQAEEYDESARARGAKKVELSNWGRSLIWKFNGESEEFWYIRDVANEITKVLEDNVEKPLDDVFARRRARRAAVHKSSNAEKLFKEKEQKFSEKTAGLVTRMYENGPWILTGLQNRSCAISGHPELLEGFEYTIYAYVKTK